MMPSPIHTPPIIREVEKTAAWKNNVHLEIILDYLDDISG